MRWMKLWVVSVLLVVVAGSGCLGGPGEVEVEEDTAQLPRLERRSFLCWIDTGDGYIRGMTNDNGDCCDSLGRCFRECDDGEHDCLLP